MPSFQIVSPEEVRRIAAEGYRRAHPEDGAPPAPPRFVAEALYIIGAEGIEIPFQGRMYGLLPVSFEHGLRLLEARNAIDAARSADTDERLVAYRAALELVVRLAPRLLRPRGRFRRFRWRLRLARNPFRRATEREVGELLGFFLASRGMSRARVAA